MPTPIILCHIRQCTLDRIICMPTPIILCHIRQCTIDATLSSHSVGTSRKHLGDACCLQAMANQACGCTETGTASTDNYSIVGMIENLVISNLCCGHSTGSQTLWCNIPCSAR